jgi:glycosyltransferase involved in cell wall biosynthesis
MNNRPIKILFISHLADWGGAQSVLHLLLKGLDKSKFEAIAVLPNDGELNLKLQQLGIKTYILELRWWLFRLEEFRDSCLEDRVEALVELIKNEQIDLVVTNTVVIVEGALAARICQVPHLWYVHEILSTDQVLRPFLCLIDLFALVDNLSAKVVVVSKAVERDLKQFYDSRKIEVLYTGLDIEQIEPSQRSDQKMEKFGVGEDVPVVTFVGFLSQRKGVLTLVDAMPLVLKQFPKTRFVIAGPDAEASEEFKSRSQAYGIAENISILGFRQDARAIIASSDLFVLPSVSDPLPVVVLEAMALGVPVVATRSGGSEEMVVDGETGLLVPINDPVALAIAINNLLSNPQKLPEMGERSRQRTSEVFSHRAYIQRFEQIFRETVEKSQQRQISYDPVAPILILLIQTYAAIAVNSEIKYQNFKIKCLKLGLRLISLIQRRHFR